MKIPISAAIIVCNEEDCIGRCLSSLKTLVDEIIVVDTGSNDRTSEIVQQFKAKLYYFSWDSSFSNARNFAISKTKNSFVLTIDADEYIANSGDANLNLQRFIAGYSPFTLGTVTLSNVCGNNFETELSNYTMSRIFKKSDFHYRGSIHEQLFPLSNCSVKYMPSGLKIHHTGYAPENNKTLSKWKRNEQHLLQALKETKDDEYLFFQLGKTYFVQKKYNKAVSALNMAAELITWNPLPPHSQYGPISESVLIDLVCSLAYSYVNINDLDSALQVLEMHTKLGHDANKYADLPHARGYVYLMKGDIKQSQEEYKRSLDYGSKSEQVRGTGSYASYFHLGLLSEAEQNQEKALFFYKRALELNANYMPALKRLKGIDKTLRI